jgi:hypothetical protein
LHTDIAKLVVRKLQEFVEEAKLVHHFERGGVDGIAAKIAQKIGMLLEDQDFNARAREKVRQDHSGRPSAGDAAARVDLLNWRLFRHD